MLQSIPWRKCNLTWAQWSFWPTVMGRLTKNCSQLHRFKEIGSEVKGKVEMKLKLNLQKVFWCKMAPKKLRLLATGVKSENCKIFLHNIFHQQSLHRDASKWCRHHTFPLLITFSLKRRSNFLQSQLRSRMKIYSSNTKMTKDFLVLFTDKQADKFFAGKQVDNKILQNSTGINKLLPRTPRIEGETS